jgi:hypothetical protein
MTITIKLVEAARDHNHVIIKARYGELSQEIKAQGDDTESAKHNLELHFKAIYGAATTVQFSIAGARTVSSDQA